MANPLTGAYQAVVQIATRQLSGILGTLHQNAAVQNAALKLIHSTTLRVGDPPRRRPDLDVFGDWLLGQRSLGRSMSDVRNGLTSTAPPGAAKLLTEAFAALDKDLAVALPRDVVRGLAKAQVSTLTVTVPNGSSSEVTVSAGLRAKYYPDPDTTALPAPLHGELTATFDVHRVAGSSGNRLTIKPSAQDAKIQFIPASGTGLDPVEVSRISAEIRKVLRSGLTQTPVDLPADFPFTDFKGLGSGANQVISLPIQLSGAALGPGSVQSNQSLVGSNGFALAISKEYVIGLIDVAAIRASVRQHTITFTISIGIASRSVQYHLDFSSGPTLTFKNGGIEISGQVDATTSTSWAPNGFIRFTQLIQLVLNPAQQTISLVRAGDPTVDKSWFIPQGRAVDIVKVEIDKALTANTGSVQSTFNDARNKLLRGLRTFDTAARVTFAAIEVTPDGVIVRGDIGSGTRRPPVVQVAETHQGTAFTALESWIPAGRIDRFVWSWVEYPPLSPHIFSGVQKSLIGQHEFILPKPAGVASLDRICLRIEGTQLAPNGQATSVGGGTTCHVQEPEFALDLPSWWGPLAVPIWQPDLNDAAPLRDGIAGHVSVQTDTPRKQPFVRNTLVVFPDWNSEKPLDAINVALSKIKNPALMAIAVLPAGAFDRSRKELAARLPNNGFAVPVHFTEDDEGAWTRTFAVGKTPSLYLVDARRKFVWKQEGVFNAAAMAEALGKHALPQRKLAFQPLQLAVSPGEPMPDALFEDDGKQSFELHRFQGRDVILNFWQSWSAPCLKELARLQRASQPSKQAPFIVAFHGGNNAAEVALVRKRLGLSFSLVHDAEQRIARRYGVRCWPTTIMIDAEGQVQEVKLGVEHEHDKPPVR